MFFIQRSIVPAPAENRVSGECPVVMPQMGGNLEEGTVIRWLKAEGEHVEQDEPLLVVLGDVMSTEILSPAADVLVMSTEILSPAAGVLRGVAVGENEAAPVGAQLAVIATQ